MLNTKLLHRAIQGSLLFASFIMLSNISHANDDAEINATFLNFNHIQFGDTRKAPWSNVQMRNLKEALASKMALMHSF